MFEHEARVALSSIFRTVCPWATNRSDILSRRLERDGNAREGDLMCYLEGDSLGPCASVPADGVSVIGSQTDVYTAPLGAIGLLATDIFSPTDPSRRGPHKYFIGEAYSGADSGTKGNKVRQLETLCEFLRRRWAEQHGGAAVADLTQVVGAAALIFSAGDSSRRAELNASADLVAQTATGPCLRRLIAARRLFVVVLEKAQSPSTFFQRAVARQLSATNANVAALTSDMTAVKSDMTAVKAGIELLLLAERQRAQPPTPAPAAAPSSSAAAAAAAAVAVQAAAGAGADSSV